MDCLSNIIGLSETTCECLTDLIPLGVTDVDVSASGIFLDKLPGLNLNVASGADDCAQGNIWQRMWDARKEAIEDYKTDLLQCVTLNYKPRIQNFSGNLGQTTFSGSMSLGSTFAGQKIIPYVVKGGYITVKRIGILIDQNANVTLQIYSNKNTSTLLFNTAVPIGALQNSLTWAVLTTPLELPMWDDSGLQIHYYIGMVLNGTFQPKKNKKDCGCSGAKEPYLNWMRIEGAHGNNTANPGSFTLNTELNGIVVDVDVKCKTLDVICNSQFPLDYENDAVARGMAKAIRFRAAAILIQNLINSDNINRFVLLDRTQLMNNIVEWNDKYVEWINYVCQNTNSLTNNDCLICKETKNALLKRSILV